MCFSLVSHAVKVKAIPFYFVFFQFHAGVLEELRDMQVITGWRNEMYPVKSSFYSPPDLLVGL